LLKNGGFMAKQAMPRCIAGGKTGILALHQRHGENSCGCSNELLKSSFSQPRCWLHLNSGHWVERECFSYERLRSSLQGCLLMG